jgi:radical S-adenosyl methionine domain-containing protein 2
MLYYLGEYLDIFAVSCDSFNEETNSVIGRQQGKKNHIECLYRVRDWCAKFNVSLSNKMMLVVAKF